MDCAVCPSTQRVRPSCLNWPAVSAICDAVTGPLRVEPGRGTNPRRSSAGCRRCGSTRGASTTAALGPITEQVCSTSER